MALSKSMSDSIPAAGYSGHIPGTWNINRYTIITFSLINALGLNTSVGKPYGVVIRELKGQSS